MQKIYSFSSIDSEFNLLLQLFTQIMLLILQSGSLECFISSKSFHNSTLIFFILTYLSKKDHLPKKK